MKHSRARIAIFAGLCLTCLVVLAGYFYRNRAEVVPVTRTAIPASPAASSAESIVQPFSKDQPPQILFRYTGIDDNYAHYGKLAMVDSTNLGHPRFFDTISCHAVHFSGGRGICLSVVWGSYPTYSADIFDASLKQLFTIPIKGSPSRTRVARSGSIGAFTVFVTGHSYAGGDFSTETLLVDLMTGQKIASLEDFRVTRDGQLFRAADFNFWGVTFTPDSRRFYCTLSSKLRHYLVEGDIATRTATVVHENVECPSVSPDGSRVAYKKRLTVEGRLFWQLHTLNLATKTETPLSEKRSVDDQLEWLDNDHVLYTMSENPDGSSASTNVWKADAEGKNPPELFLPKAFSPAVVR